MRSLLVAAGACALLWGVERGLASRAPISSAARHFAPLVESPPSAVTAFRLHPPGEAGAHLYRLEAGVWRVPTAFGAPALEPEVGALLADLLEARGQEVARPERGSAYGLAREERWVVELFGPGTELDAEAAGLRLELGRSLPGVGGGRGFARRGADGPVLELDRDPRARLLLPEGERLPPLLDQRLLAGEWPARGQGIERAFVDHADGRALELSSELLGPAPGPGMPAPRRWFAREGERRSPCLPFRVAAWQAFLYRLPYRGLTDPTAAERRGLDRPVAKLTLLQLDSEPVELVVGRSAETGATFVLNSKTGLLCLVDRAEAELLLASLEGLCSSEIENPWEAWLPR